MKARFAGMAVTVVLTILTGCVHTELVDRDFDGERLYIDVRVEPDAVIDASYFLKIDPDDPVGTIVSIGSSVAKAAQVEEAQARMDRAVQRTDLDEIVRTEAGNHFAAVERMRVVDRPAGADYVLDVEIWRYGIRADDELGGTFFEMHARSALHDSLSGTVVWDDFAMVQERIGPELFGIPSADNILSAVMLASLSEEEMSAGITKVTQQVSDEIAAQFSKDLQRAHRRRR